VETLSRRLRTLHMHSNVLLKRNDHLIKEIPMNPLHNTLAQKKVSEQKEIRPFRSEVQSAVVGKADLKTTDLTGRGPDGVKVSQFRLEQYLNACNPTCHG
jgi:hypothetical protein